MTATDHQNALALAPRGSSSHLNKPARQVVPAFLQKLYEMVNDPSDQDLIRWSDSGDSFFVLDQERFASEVLGRWFKHKNFSSFVRQLNMYGFHKIPHLQQGVLRSDQETDFWNFEHPNFVRGQPDLLCLIQRKKQTPAGAGVPAGNAQEDATQQQAALAPAGSAGANGTPAVGTLNAGQVLDVNQIVNGIAAIKRHQATISSDLNALRSSNQELWREAMAARERHKKHQDTINKILKFLASVFGHHNHGSTPLQKGDTGDGETNAGAVVPRSKSGILMIDDGRKKAGQDEANGFFSSLASPTSPTGMPSFQHDSSRFVSIEPSVLDTPGGVTPEAQAPTSPTREATPRPFLTPPTSVSQTSTTKTPSSSTSLNTPTPPSSTSAASTFYNAPPQSDTPIFPQNSNFNMPDPSYFSQFPMQMPYPMTIPVQNSNDAVLNSALAQVLQSPQQMQRLLAALAGQQASPYLSYPPSLSYPPPEGGQDGGGPGAGGGGSGGNGEGGGEGLLAHSFFANMNMGANAVAPPAGLSNASQPTGGNGDRAQGQEQGQELTSYAPLQAHDERLQRAYQNTSEIESDVNALHTSLNSLIESLGLDPQALAAAAAAQQQSGTGASASANVPGVGLGAGENGNGEDGAGHEGVNSAQGGADADFDFDAFLNSSLGDASGIGFGPSGMGGYDDAAAADLDMDGADADMASGADSLDAIADRLDREPGRGRGLVADAKDRFGVHSRFGSGGSAAEFGAGTGARAEAGAGKSAGTGTGGGELHAFLDEVASADGESDVSMGGLSSAAGSAPPSKVGGGPGAMLGAGAGAGTRGRKRKSDAGSAEGMPLTAAEDGTRGAGTRTKRKR